MKINSIIQGNTLEQLKKLPSESIDTIITSPPYWGLRDYGEDTKTIWDGDKNCKHIWKTIERKLHSGTGSDFCQKCGAWYGQLGLEPTLDLYIEHLLQITAELKRVLKKSGVIFWNHGDAYASGGTQRFDKNKYGGKSGIHCGRARTNNYQQKCMLLQNWRLILRMIDEQGWILRNTIIWNKPNAMPSSVHDRFANKYEPVFMLVKNKKYFFDLDAVRIPTKTNENRPYGIVREREFGYNTQFPEARKKSAAYNWELKNTPKPMEWRKNAFNYRVRDAEKKSKQCPQFRATKEEIEMYKKEWQKQKELSYGNDDKGTRRSRVMAWLNTKRKTSIPEDQKEQNSAISRGKNPGDVWEIATQPCPKEFRGIHFASFPEKLIKPMILAGCPAQICKKCGKARERITNKKYTTSPGQPPPFTKQQGKQFQSKIKGEMKYPVRYETEYQTIGWTKCNCENPEYEAGVVLDPFIGIGTTAVIAKKLGRNFIGIEISNKYCKVANKRLENTIRQEELLSN